MEHLPLYTTFPATLLLSDTDSGNSGSPKGSLDLCVTLSSHNTAPRFPEAQRLTTIPDTASPSSKLTNAHQQTRLNLGAVSANPFADVQTARGCRGK